MTTINPAQPPVIVRAKQSDVRFDETGPQVVVRPPDTGLVINVGTPSDGTGSGPGHDHPIEDRTITYDADGNISQVDIVAGGGWTMTYDGDGRISTVSDQSSTLVRNLAYDGEGRISSVTHTGG